MDTPYFNRAEAAAYIRHSVPQLDNLARRGEVKRVKIGEGPRSRVLYRRQDLDDFMERHIEGARGDGSSQGVG